MAIASLKRVYMAYTSDDGNVYQIGTSLDNCTAGGGTPEAAGAHPALPRGWVPRHVCGVDDNGKTSKIPIAAPTNALFVGSGGTFTKDATTYAALSRIGERRVSRGGGPVPG